MSNHETERFNEQRKEEEDEREERRLMSQIESILIDFAPLFNELTTSDLQGVANVEARKIVELIRGK